MSSFRTERGGFVVPSEAWCVSQMEVALTKKAAPFRAARGSFKTLARSPKPIVHTDQDIGLGKFGVNRATSYTCSWSERRP